MIDKPKTRAYLKAMVRRVLIPLTCVFFGVFLLLGFPGQPLTGAVQDANPGRDGQPVDLKSLPVKGKTTVVDCYSPFCPPCVRIAPLLEELANKRPDLVIKKLNIQRPEVVGKIDWQSPAAKQLSIRSVPHFMIFDKKGKVTAEGKEATNQVLGWLQEAGLLKK